MSVQSPVLRQALVDKVMQHDSKNKRYKCLVCRIEMPGEASGEAHLMSRSHREEGSMQAVKNLLSQRKNPPSLQNFLSSNIKVAVNENVISVKSSKEYICNRCNLNFTGIKPLEEHLKSLNHVKAKGGNQPAVVKAKPMNISAPSGFPQISQPSGSSAPAVDIASELADGTVIETDNKTDPFKCVICNKKFNSQNTLSDHLKSNKHKNKKISDGGGQSTNSCMGGANSSPKDSGDEERYTVQSNPRGHVYVFNYMFKGTDKERSGAELDSSNLEKTFTGMGYRVFSFGDLTRDDTYGKLEAIRRDSTLQKIDAFIMCFLSHGLDPDTFWSSDRKDMSLQHIIRLFMDGKCPHLRGKPRIFFANYCRGKEFQKKDVREYDTIEAPSDMIVIHAATEGIMAVRKRSIGTAFISSLCELLREHARGKELHSIYIKLKVKMQDNGGTRPMLIDYCFRRFYFNPR